MVHLKYALMMVVEIGVIYNDLVDKNYCWHWYAKNNMSYKQKPNCEPVTI